MAGKSNSWAKDLEYQKKCVLAVCNQLKITDPNEISYIAEVASHSLSDGNFFSKIKTLYTLSKKEAIVKEDKEKSEKVIVSVKEYNDGKSNRIPAFLEARLRDLQGDS
ncbi:MAG: hypothetical protein J6S85_26400 [Methanobrevibacter sp.]|nr:hypothetical protein [Methanobrevibacter sp.]MBO7717125.1 hypothetical protein [Methanobrevibacter sp.]